jgi:hypothetical protein
LTWVPGPKNVGGIGQALPGAGFGGGVQKILVTGTAGFIGFHLAARLLKAGHLVHGYDGMTPYYDVALKQRRHAVLLQTPRLFRDRGDAGGHGNA